MSRSLRALIAAGAECLPRVAAAGLALAATVLLATHRAGAVQPRGGSGGSGVGAVQPSTPATGSAPGSSTLSLARQVGQLLIATYPGRTPPASLLSAIRAGHVGAVILMGPNTSGGVRATRAATALLQAAAVKGGNPGLLIMTDQEGGAVKRLPGPPRYAATDMADPATAFAQGQATGRLLRAAGVNVDLAPVADVARVDGFIEREGRSFGASPAAVSSAACQFAAGLARMRIAYTLKHFPGLGDARATTDARPVSVRESAAKLYADGAAYRRCGHGRLALVMISSASYPRLTGSVPAVLDPRLYSQVLPADRITALPITDSFESGAINAVASKGPARTAINAGVDMVMYSGYESVALSAYATLLAEARTGALSPVRVRAASARVLQLKAQLGLVGGLEER